MSEILLCSICERPIFNLGTDGIPLRAHGVPPAWVHWSCVAEWDRRYIAPPPEEPQDEPGAKQ
jgi:hypothetical protein